MANIIEKGFDGFNILLKRIDFLKSTENFIEWAKDKKLKGNGKSDNPYVINSSIELPKKLFLSKLDIYILMESREFDLLDLKKCKKITIKNCKFTKLTLLKCRDLTIFNSDINILNILKSKELEFKNSKISTKFDYYGKNNEYFETSVSSDYFDKKELVKDRRSLYIIFPLIAIIIVLTNLTVIYTPVLSNPETVLISNIVTILSLFLVYLITKNSIFGHNLKKKKLIKI